MPKSAALNSPRFTVRIHAHRVKRALTKFTV
jgi:hypothetical protein